MDTVHTDYANVYELIFQTRIDDRKTYEQVQSINPKPSTIFSLQADYAGIVGVIANSWEERDSRIDSMVRICCDQGSMNFKVQFRYLF